jgi:hypothetical protein
MLLSNGGLKTSQRLSTSHTSAGLKLSTRADLQNLAPDQTGWVGARFCMPCVQNLAGLFTAGAR